MDQRSFPYAQGQVEELGPRIEEALRDKDWAKASRLMPLFIEQHKKAVTHAELLQALVSRIRADLALWRLHAAVTRMQDLMAHDSSYQFLNDLRMQIQVKVSSAIRNNVSVLVLLADEEPDSTVVAVASLPVGMEIEFMTLELNYIFIDGDRFAGDRYVDGQLPIEPNKAYRVRFSLGGYGYYQYLQIDPVPLGGIPEPYWVDHQGNPLE